MYCKICGNLIDNNSEVCRICGAPVGDDASEEIIFNEIPEEISSSADDDLDITLKEKTKESFLTFVDEKSTEETNKGQANETNKEQSKGINKEQSKEIPKIDLKLDESIKWDVHDFSNKSKKRDEIDIVWNLHNDENPKEQDDDQNKTRQEFVGFKGGHHFADKNEASQEVLLKEDFIEDSYNEFILGMSESMRTKAYDKLSDEITADLIKKDPILSQRKSKKLITEMFNEMMDEAINNDQFLKAESLLKGNEVDDAFERVAFSATNKTEKEKDDTFKEYAFTPRTIRNRIDTLKAEQSVDKDPLKDLATLSDVDIEFDKEDLESSFQALEKNKATKEWQSALILEEAKEDKKAKEQRKINDNYKPFGQSLQEEQIFNFNSKNENFQKVLDDELLKINKTDEDKEAFINVPPTEKITEKAADESASGMRSAKTEKIAEKAADESASGMQSAKTEKTAEKATDESASGMPSAKTEKIAEKAADESASGMPSAKTEKTAEKAADEGASGMPSVKQKEQTVSETEVFEETEQGKQGKQGNRFEKFDEADVIEELEEAQENGSIDADFKTKDTVPVDFIEENKDGFGAVTGTRETRNSGKKKNKVLTIVFIILIILLILELTALGIKYLMPNSAAAETIRQTENKIAAPFVSLVSKIKGEDTDEQSEVPSVDEVNDMLDETLNEDPVFDLSTINREPAADKSEIILEKQSDNLNNNIQSIKTNDALKYNSSTNYKITTVKDSVPIEDNFWYLGNNNQVNYFDREIVGTLIRFDSAWINYVNQGDRDVFNLIKKGSTAEENAEKFVTAGKEESFASLEIGEIRKDDVYFYIWVKEEIELTENNKTSTKSYNWVYQLVTVDSEMQIVNYCKF